MGAGGHGTSLAEFAGEEISGYVSREPNNVLPGEWKGTDEVKETLIQAGYPFHIAYVYSGLPRMEGRRKLIEEYEKSGAVFKSLISPTAIITPHAEIGKGCAVMCGAIVNRAKLDSHVIVNSGAIVEHDCEIGSNTFIGPGAVIGGFTKIGKNCFIGLGARIGNGLTIGDNISIAMGAVVSRNLTDPGIYHGSPLRCLKNLEP